jgi:HNH endonuclease
MSTCQVCLRQYHTLKFQTERIKICGHCVSMINSAAKPASVAQADLAELLERGIRRNALQDLESPDAWLKSRATEILENIQLEVKAGLNGWVTRLLSNPQNNRLHFRMMRAYRRGLLRMDGFADYPGNWGEVARKIRGQDERCMACGGTQGPLHVHHIIYLSKHGTNRQENLVALCRTCHEAEHGTEFDWLESEHSKQIQSGGGQIGNEPRSPSDLLADAVANLNKKKPSGPRNTQSTLLAPKIAQPISLSKSILEDRAKRLERLFSSMEAAVNKQSAHRRDELFPPIPFWPYWLFSTIALMVATSLLKGSDVQLGGAIVSALLGILLGGILHGQMEKKRSEKIEYQEFEQACRQKIAAIRTPVASCQACGVEIKVESDTTFASNDVGEAACHSCGTLHRVELNSLTASIAISLLK